MEDDNTANDGLLGSHGNPDTDGIPATVQAGSPPPLDTAFADDSARERLYSGLVQTREPTSATAIADQAGCHPDTARKYLNWYAQLGVADRHDGRPTTYERNEAYFEWRYVTELANTNTLDDLREHLHTIQTRLETYRDEYGADDPSLVDACEAADDPAEIDAVWRDLAHWASLEAELRLHERARQRLTTHSHFDAVQG